MAGSSSDREAQFEKLKKERDLRSLQLENVRVQTMHEMVHDTHGGAQWAS